MPRRTRTENWDKFALHRQESVKSEFPRPRPSISVILPVYNQADYLSSAVESVLNQRHVDVELIIIDDGSTDDPASRLKSVRENPAVRLVRQENGGVSSALNAGFLLASAPLLTWTSADNLYRKGALNTLASGLVSAPLAALCYADVELIDDRSKAAKNSSYRPQDQDLREPSRLRLPRFGATLGAGADNGINACFAYRRDSLAVVSQYNSRLKGFEDFDYWLRLSLLGKVAHVATKRAPYAYRIHDNALTATLAANSLADAVRAHVERWDNFLPQHSRLTSYLAFERPEAALALELLPSSWAHLSLTIESVQTDECPLATALRLNEVNTRTHFEGLRKAAVSASKQSDVGGVCSEATMTHDSLAGRQLVLPPLFPISPSFLRARDADSGAIQPHSPDSPVVLIFLSDKYRYPTLLELLKRSIAANRRATFAFVVFDGTGRQIADSLGSAEPRRFRILDLTEQRAAGPACGRLVPSALEQALAFALSSCDGMLTTCDCAERESQNAAYFTDFWLECFLAASAGVPLHVISSETFLRSLAPSTPREHQGLFNDQLHSAPHIVFHASEFGKVLQSWEHSLPTKAIPIEKLTELAGQLPLQVYDDWIESQSQYAQARRLAASVCDIAWNAIV